MLSLLLVCHHSRLTVEPNPPQPVPLVLVMVDENGDRRVRRDVAKALEVGRSFRLGINGEVQNLPVKGKGNRHEMWSPITAHGCHARNPGRLHAATTVSRIHYRSLSARRAKQVGRLWGYG